MQVVQVHAAFRNELFANPHRKRQIGHPITVQVTDFPTADKKEDDAAAMSLDVDVRPRCHFTLNAAGD
jgi:hypothetical protein